MLRHWTPRLSHSNRVRVVTRYFRNMYINVILPSTQMPPTLSQPVRFSDSIYYALHVEKYQLWDSAACQFSLLPSSEVWLLSSARCSQTVCNIIILCVFTFILNTIITFVLPNLFARSFVWAIWSVLAKWGHIWACVYTSFRSSSDLAVSSAESPYQVFFLILLSLPKTWRGGGHEKYAQTVSYRKAWWLGLLWFPGQRVVPVRLPSRRLGANFYFQLAALSGSLALCCETVEPRDARLLKLTSYRTQCVSNTISPRMSWNNATKNANP